ncbi:MAG: ribonuclease III [Candidatus Zeuxoniibacter abyssi]|nr:MAG: ribonuclease III [Candidatus Persebacteraceae bacterium AB1(2)]
MNWGYPFHRFQDTRLAEVSLTHKSFGAPNNERLEWLGDALLDFFIARLLYERHPQSDEGRLTQARARLVGGPMLAKLCRLAKLPPMIKMSAAEDGIGGRERNSLLADILKSYMAAVYLDGGEKAAMCAVTTLFDEELEKVGVMLADGGEELKDAKTRLQELLQNLGREVPNYRLIEQSGLSHAPRFFVECLVDGEVLANAEGGSRRAAEMMAAEYCLERLEAENLASAFATRHGKNRK